MWMNLHCLHLLFHVFSFKLLFVLFFLKIVDELPEIPGEMKLFTASALTRSSRWELFVVRSRVVGGEVTLR